MKGSFLSRAGAIGGSALLLAHLAACISLSPTATRVPTFTPYPTSAPEPTDSPTIPPPPPPPTRPSTTPAPFPTFTPPGPTLTPVPPTPAITVNEAQVVEVVDGDTIKVLIDGEAFTVRYIGIDSPETKDPDTGVEWMGPEATEANRRLVEGRTVLLEKDVSETDRYGRLLRYVYVGDTFVNEELVRQGYAQVSVYPPDVKYVDLFIAAQREAMAAGRGLWSAAPTITAGPTQPPPPPTSTLWPTAGPTQPPRTPVPTLPPPPPTATLRPLSQYRLPVQLSRRPRLP